VCAPYRVAALEGAGRGLVAVRDIRKGELVFTMLPAALGPTARTSVPQCVSCFSLLHSPSTAPSAVWTCVGRSVP